MSDPAVLARIHSLELQARAVVEGYLAGMHRSARHGFAVEFAQHREYVPGDDFKHIDWKVFGRTERYFLKQYELETNLVAWLFADVSDSMAYGSGAVTKYDLACTAALALGHLLVRQGDSVGLAAFDDRVRRFLRPSSQASQLKELARQLGAGPAGEKTRLGAVLHELAERVPPRGLVLLFSDLFDEPAELLAGLRHLRYAQHEVVVFHVLDAAELDFPFQRVTLFRGLEQLPDLLTDPRGVRQGYLDELHGFLREIRRGCRDLRIDYVPLRTGEDLGLALAAYLSRRADR
ncbi:MAG TPA: DUF58 domain-containing protein [Gemmataceae bacterium]